MICATVDQIRAKVRSVIADASSYGGLSTCEQIAVAFVLDQYDLVHRYGTMLEAVNRLGPEWTAAALHVQRHSWAEDAE